MTRKEFVEKLFNANIFTQYPDAVCTKGCQGFACPQDSLCDTCKYADFWNEEVTLSELYANLSSSDAGKMLYKGFLNSMYGVPTIKCHDTDCTGDLRTAFWSTNIDKFPHVMNLPIDNWVEVPSALIADEVCSIGEILDDATVHGLDFKYENGKFYFKDRQVSMFKDTQDVD